jgi:hypothetical protein
MLCLTCHRVRPALDRTDYTADRALLIVRRGLCACGAPPARPGRRRRTGGAPAEAPANANAPANASANANANANGSAAPNAAGSTTVQTPGTGPKPANNTGRTSPVSRRFA